jgi:hypothetical protein
LIEIRLLWVLLVGALSCRAQTFPGPLDVPDDPRIREALDRISVRAGLALPRASWPLTAAEASAILARAGSVGAISSADSSDLLGILPGSRELARWGDSTSNLLAIHARAGGGAQLTDSGYGRNERLGWLGGRAYGVAGGTLWYYSDARIFTRWSDDRIYWDRYSLADGEPSGVPLDQASPDGRYSTCTGARYVAWVQWTRDWISLKYGRDRVRFGPGEWTGLTTTLSTPPYQMLDTRLKMFPWLSIQAMVLEARPEEPLGGAGFPGDARKWVHVHRFELLPIPSLEFAFQNQVVYKDSGGVNPAYLLPLVPIFFSQDLAGNRDNSAMQFDFSWTSPWGIRIWSALLVDDLNSLGDFFGSSWLNRWAFLAGGRVVSPWPRADADLTAEFSFVRPWTFTGGREASYSFAHYGLPMGTELGPDSRTFHLRGAWRPESHFEAGLSFESLEKGLGPQATLGQVNRTSSQSPASSFGEGKERTFAWGSDLTAEWTPVSLAIGVRWVDFRNSGSESGSWAEPSAQATFNW